MQDLGENEINLLDLIDIELLQEFQDSYATAMGIASITVDDNGPITKPSNFTDFCIKLTRESKEGYKRCNACDIAWGKVAAQKGEPVIYNCHTGLTDFAVPIIVDGKHIASILGGQILTEPPNEEHFRKLAIELGIDEDEYIKAVKKLSIVSKKSVVAAANFAFLFANTISKIAMKNLELKKKNTREKLFWKISDVIRSSLDLKETLSFICRELTNVFGLQRASISQFESYTDYLAPIIMMEYKTRPDLSGIKQLGHIPEISEFFGKRVMETADVLAVGNIQDDKDIPDFFKEEYTNIGVKSIMAIPIMKDGYKWGILVLTSVDNYLKWSQDDVDLAKAFANQIYIAISQAEVYTKEKQIVEREKIINSVISNSLSTFDINQLKPIVKDVCEVADADRCYFVEVDLDSFHGKPINYDGEYLKNDDVKSIIGYQFSTEQVEAFIKQFLKNRDLTVYNYKELLKDDSAEFESIRAYAKLFDLKYGLAIPMFDANNKLTSVLAIEYQKEHNVLGNDDLDFLRTLGHQASMAYNQIKLFQDTQKIAQREMLIRSITEKIRSSLDLDETFSFICTETAKLFDVERVAITNFSDPKNYSEFIVKKEYKRNPDMMSFYEQPEAKRIAKYWAENMFVQGQIMSLDNLESSDLPDYFKQTYKNMGVKSIIGVPIKKGNDIWGTLILSKYDQVRHWTNDDTELLSTLADQVYLAINQAELFESAQKKADNERVLRDIMISSVKSFDVKDIINTIVNETGQLFNADRCFFVEYSNEQDAFKPIKEYAQFLMSKDIRTHVEVNPGKEQTAAFIQVTKNKKIQVVSNINEIELPEPSRHMLVDELSVKSYLISPVFYGDIRYGSLVLHYVKDFKYFTQDELEIAEAVAYQSAVILHQAELYEITKLQAERERISKNIIEILRSTLDKNIIKKLFVKNIGKFLEADRVIFSEFDSETNMYLPVDSDSEYLSSPEIKSLVNYDWTQPETQDYIQPLLEKREFHIYNLAEYLQGSYKDEGFIEFFENSDIKSAYSFPVMYQQKLMGFFSISYMHNVRRLVDEDINRIRSICTQAGIALYHANLYKEAQKSVQAHAEFVNKLSGELREPLAMIVEFSDILASQDLEREKEISHLKTIKKHAQNLLYLLDDWIDRSAIRNIFN